MRKNKSTMRMSRGDPTPLVDRNRRRSYNAKEEMQRWVGSSIADSFKGPEVDKVQVKLSKKFLKMANPKQNTYKVPSTMNNFMHQPAERCQWQTHVRHNDANRFIWVDGNRKVGRQLIPKQYIEREAMLRNSMPDVASKNLGSAAGDYENGLGQAHDDVKQQTRSSFASRDSLPHSQNLKALVELSCQQVAPSKRIPTHGRGISYDEAGFQRIHIGLPAKR